MDLNNDYTILFKRGSGPRVLEYVGDHGELVFNKTTKKLHLQDGVTPGGFSIGAGDVRSEKPLLVSPASGALLTGVSLTVSVAAYVGDEETESLQIQVGKTPDLAVMYRDTGWIADTGSHAFTLEVSTYYYLRVRRRFKNGRVTPWTDSIAVRSGAGWNTYFTAAVQTGYNTTVSRTTVANVQTTVVSNTFSVTTLSTYLATATRTADVTYQEMTSHNTSSPRATEVLLRTESAGYRTTYRTLERNSIVPATTLNRITSVSVSTSKSTKKVRTLAWKSTSGITQSQTAYMATSGAGKLVNVITGRETTVSTVQPISSTTTHSTKITQNTAWLTRKEKTTQRDTNFIANVGRMTTGAGGTSYRTEWTDDENIYITRYNTSYWAGTSRVLTIANKTTSVVANTSKATSFQRYTSWATEKFSYSMVQKQRSTAKSTSYNVQVTVFEFTNTTYGTQKSTTTEWTEAAHYAQVKYTEYWETEIQTNFYSKFNTLVSRATEYSTDKIRQSSWHTGGYNSSYEQTNFWETSTTYEAGTEWTTTYDSVAYRETMVETSTFTVG